MLLFKGKNISAIVMHEQCRLETGKYAIYIYFYLKRIGVIFFLLYTFKNHVFGLDEMLRADFSIKLRNKLEHDIRLT
jgi:hypothetical protein